MPGRVKYPLTEEAKEAARGLVEAWNSGELQQLFYVYDVTSLGDEAPEIITGLGATKLRSLPPLGILLELAQYGLLSLEPSPRSAKGDAWQILLLQELRNAVRSDFEVSDFFLTTTAVGNIIMNATVNAPVQGVGQALAPVTQNVELIVGEIKAMLGERFIEEHPDIERALKEFDDAPAEQLPNKGRRLIKSLAEVLQGVEQAAGVLQAIIFLSQFLQPYF